MDLHDFDYGQLCNGQPLGTAMYVRVIPGVRSCIQGSGGRATLGPPEFYRLVSFEGRATELGFQQVPCFTTSSTDGVLWLRRHLP